MIEDEIIQDSNPTNENVAIRSSYKFGTMKTLQNPHALSTTRWHFASSAQSVLMEDDTTWWEPMRDSICYAQYSSKSSGI